MQHARLLRKDSAQFFCHQQMQVHIPALLQDQAQMSVHTPALLQDHAASLYSRPAPASILILRGLQLK